MYGLYTVSGLRERLGILGSRQRNEDQNINLPIFKKSENFLKKKGSMQDANFAEGAPARFSTLRYENCFLSGLSKCSGAFRSGS